MKRKRRNPPKGSILIYAVYDVTFHEGSVRTGDKLYFYDPKTYTFWSDIFGYIRTERARSLKTLEDKWHKDAKALDGYITKVDIQFTEIGVL